MTEYDDESLPQPQYGLPDPPSLDLTKFMVEDKPFIKDSEKHIIEGDIPEDMLHKFWGFLNKDSVVTKLDHRDLALSKIRFKRAKLAYMMSTPRQEFTYQTIRHLNNLEHKSEMKNRRSLDGFEREMQTRQTQAMIYGEMGNQSRPQGQRSRFNPLSALFGR